MTKRVNYRAYLVSDAWREKRSEARKRARGRCRVCGSRIGLETHHKTYRNLGEERQHELVMLCAEHHEGCHDFISAWRKRRHRRLSDYTLTMKYIARERKRHAT